MKEKQKFQLISIVAVAKNNVIGNNGRLIWHIPEDLKHFKKLTLGHPMIMGRKTFESFPKPLPGRIHIVISKNPKPNTENIIWVNSIEKAINKAKELDNEKAYIIGGGKIYAQTMDLIDVLEITKIDENFEGDTYFPKIDYTNFKLKNSKKLKLVRSLMYCLTHILKYKIIMKKLILSTAIIFSIVSCGKKETSQESVETNSAPTVEQSAPTEADAPEVEEENVLVIEGNDQMQFNKNELKAKAGKPITLTLKHTGSSDAKIMGHNFVLLKPGTDINKFGTDAATKSSLEESYIPKEDASDVIAHTKVVGGGESDTITIDNLEPGTYDYICSFPGHYGIMKGKLIVE